MSAIRDDQILRELRTEAAKWVMKTLPDRLSGVGVDEIEVRKQLETEADHWVQYNLKQRREGKEGTPSPDFHLNEERPEMVPTVRGPVGKSDWHDEECWQFGVWGLRQSLAFRAWMPDFIFSTMLFRPKNLPLK